MVMKITVKTTQTTHNKTQNYPDYIVWIPDPSSAGQKQLRSRLATDLVGEAWLSSFLVPHSPLAGSLSDPQFSEEFQHGSVGVMTFCQG